MKYIFLLSSVLFYLTSAGQPHSNLSYGSGTSPAECCNGDMLGYSVWIVDTVNNAPVYRHDSVRYYFDSQNRIHKIALYEQPGLDSAFILDELVRVTFESDSNLATEATFGKGSDPPGQPSDSTHWEYYNNGALKQYTFFWYKNDQLEPANRTDYFIRQDGHDTARKYFTYLSNGWEASSYTRVYHNVNNRDSVHLSFTFNNSKKVLYGKVRYTYDQYGRNDTVTSFNYDDAMQSFIPATKIIQIRRQNGDYEKFYYLTYDEGTTSWDTIFKSIFYYNNGLNTKIVDYSKDFSGDSLKLTDFYLSDYNEKGLETRNWHYQISSSDDTVLVEDIRHKYHNNNYPDSSIYYGRDIAAPYFNVKYSKYYYSNISSTRGMDKDPLEVKLYPNPAKSHLMLSLNKQAGTDIRYLIISQDGKVIDNGLLWGMGNRFEMPLPDAPGMYLYHLEIDNQSVTKKIIRK